MNKQDLHKYQETGVMHLIRNYFAALFLDMGLGKTVTTLTAINKLMFEDLEVSKVLLIAPKRVVESVWDFEARKWTHLSHFKFSKIIGSEKQRRAALAAKADIYMISRDNISWLCGLYGGSMLPFDMLVIDELSSFKSPKSQRFKALKAVQPSFNRVVGLTGTPAPNGLIDLWSQLYLLDRGERLGKTITSYREKYFANLSRDPNYGIYKASEENQNLIHSKIKDICLSMRAKDYLELPDVIVNDVRVVFPDKIQEAYDDFEREKVLELMSCEEEITAMNAAALSNKLLQYANGAVYDERKNYHVVHDLKLEAVEELIEEANGKPVLIAWTYRHDMMRLKERLKKHKPRELKDDQDIRDWNKGLIQVLLMHPASGGHGLNLQEGGNIIIWFGQTWALELYQQLNARLARQGQKCVVTIHRLVAFKTLDQKVIASLEGKNRTQDDLMDSIKALVKKHLQK